MIRRSSRIAVVQGLYQFDVSEDAEILSIIDEFINFRQAKFATLHNIGGRFDVEFFKDLLLKATEHLNEIDEIIIKLLPESWPIARIAKTLLAILRSGTTELMYFQGIPFKVIINEYLEIAKIFGADEKEKIFINGVLNAISDNVRSNEKKHF